MALAVQVPRPKIEALFSISAAPGSWGRMGGEHPQMNRNAKTPNTARPFSMITLLVRHIKLDAPLQILIKELEKLTIRCELKIIDRM